MATQLSKQLKQLQADRIKGNLRPSVLFSSREAAEYDLATIHGIGLNGLAELLQLDSDRFASFQRDLFGTSWASIDRETSTQDVGDAINERISAFARAVCPYVQLRAAHKCFEWLVRRFRAHVYNIDALMEAALPHCESVFFGRIVQLLELGASRDALGPGSSTVGLWHFLTPNQKAGAPLPREILARQCLKDAGVLKFTCEIARRSAAACRAGSCKPDTCLTWWSLLSVEVLTRAPTVTDTLLHTMLPTIVEGIKDSTVKVYQQTAYAVAAAALSGSRAAGSRKLLIALLQALIAHMDTQEPGPAMHALLAIVAGQAHHQGLQEVGSSAPSGSDDPSAWLSSYRLDAGQVSTCMLQAVGVPALLAQAASAGANVLPGCSLLLHSAIACVAAGSLPAPHAERLCNEVRKALLALPAPVSHAMAAALTRTVMREVQGIQAAATRDTVGGVMKTLYEVAGSSVDTVLRVAGSDPSFAPAMPWVGQCLTVQGMEGAMQVALAEGVTWTAGLQHASAYIREQSVSSVRSLVSSSTFASSSLLHGQVCAALDRALQDEDAGVVLAALGVHSHALSRGHVLCPEGKASRLVTSALFVLRAWVPLACVRVESLLQAHMQAGAGAEAAEDVSEGAAAKQGLNRRAQREQNAMLKHLSSVVAAPKEGHPAGTAPASTPAVEAARISAALDARRVVRACLALLTTQIPSLLSADAPAFQSITVAILSLLPVGAEQVHEGSKEYTSASLRKAGVALRQGEDSMPVSPQCEAMQACVSLGLRHGLKFPLFAAMASQQDAAKGLTTTARLACALLQTLASPGRPGTHSLSAILAAWEESTSAPIPHAARARLVSLCVLDAALGYLVCLCAGTVDSLPALVRPLLPHYEGMGTASSQGASGTPVGGKGKKRAQAAAAGDDAAQAAPTLTLPVLEAFLLACSGVLREEWRTCTSALSLVSMLKRDAAGKVGDKRRNSSVGATAVGGGAEEAGISIADACADEALHSGLDGLVPALGVVSGGAAADGVQLVSLRKCVGEADEDPLFSLASTVTTVASSLRSSLTGASEDKARHELLRRSNKVKARSLLVAGAWARVLKLCALAGKGSADKGTEQQSPVTALLDASATSSYGSSAPLPSMAARALLMLLATPHPSVAWTVGLGGLCNVALAAAMASAGTAVTAKGDVLMQLACASDTVGPLASARALHLAMHGGAAGVAQLLAPVAIACCLAEQQGQSDAFDAGRELRAAGLAAARACAAAPSAQSWHGSLHALLAAPDAVLSQAALTAHALTQYIAALPPAELTSAVTTLWLPCIQTLCLSGPLSSAAARLAAVLAQACRVVSSEAGKQPTGVVAALAKGAAACIAAVSASNAARPGQVQCVVSLLSALSTVLVHQRAGVLGGEAGSAVGEAITAALALPPALLVVPLGMPLSAAAVLQGAENATVAVVPAAVRCVTPHVWSSLCKEAVALPTLAVLLSTVSTGSPATASAAKSCLSGLTFPSSLLLEYLGKACSVGTAAVTAGLPSVPVEPSFGMDKAVQPVLRAWLPARVAVGKLSTLCVLLEVVHEALQGGQAEGAAEAGSHRVESAASLLPTLWTVLASVIALPSAASWADSKGLGAGGAEMQGAGSGTAESGLVDMSSALEYACQLLLACLAGCLAAPGAQAVWTKSSLPVLLPLHVARTSTSSQTVSAALTVCAALAKLAPVDTLGHLLPLMSKAAQTAGSRSVDAGPGGWNSVLRVVTAILPSLRAAGPALGLTPHALLAVFSGVLPSIAPHRQRGLYSNLLQALAGVWSGPTGGSGSSHPVGPLAALLLARAVTASASALAQAAAAAEDSDDMEEEDANAPVPSASKVALVGDAGPGFNLSVPHAQLGEEPSALGHTSDLVSALLGGYSVPQQVAALAHMLSLAHALLGHVASIDAGQAASVLLSDPAPAAKPLTLSTSTSTSGGESDVAAVLPLVLAGGVFSSAASSANCLQLQHALSLALGTLRLAAVHVGTREFMHAAAAAAASAAKRDEKEKGSGKSGTDSGSAKLQKSYLALTERLFDVLQTSSSALAACISEVGLREAALQQAMVEASKQKGSAQAKAAALTAARAVEGAKLAVAAWVGCQDAACALLDRLAALLAPAAFVAVVGALLHHSHPGVRARALVFLADFCAAAYGPSPGPVPDADARLYVTLVPDLATAITAVVQGGSSALGGHSLGGLDELSHARVALEAGALLAVYLSSPAASDGSAPGGAAPFTASARSTCFKPLVQAVQGVLPRLLQATTDGHAAVVAEMGPILTACTRLVCGLGGGALPLLPSLLSTLLASAEWCTGKDVQGKLLPSALLGMQAAMLAALDSLLATLPTFMSAHVPRTLQLLLSPALLGGVTPSSLPPMYMRTDRRVLLGADGTPQLNLPGDEGNTERTGPRAALPHHVTHGIVTGEAGGAADGSAVAEQAQGVQHQAARLLAKLCTALETRVLLPALLDCWTWASSSRAGPASPAILLRSLTRVVQRLDRPAVREALPRLLPSLLSSMDWRWSAVEPSSVATFLHSSSSADDKAAAAVALHRSLLPAALVECEVHTLLTVLVLRLGEKALRPLFARLAAWASASEVDVAAAAEADSAELEAMGKAVPAGYTCTPSQGSAGFWSYACLCRRISYYRALTAVSSVARAALTPFILRALTDAAREVVAVCAGLVAAPSSASGTGKRKSGADSAAGAGSAKRARSDSSAGATDSQGGGLAMAGALSYGTLIPLDGLWCPIAFHEVPMPGPGSDASLSAALPSTIAAVANSQAAVVPSTPHALRCTALGFMRCALAHESIAAASAAASTAGVDSALFPRKGVAGGERVEALLAALTAAMRMPLAMTVTAPLHGKGGKAVPLDTSSTTSPSPSSLYTAVAQSGVPGGQAGFTLFTEAYIAPLVGVLTAASGRDTLWKPVAQAALHALRDDSPRIRLCALRWLAALYAAGSDDALVLVPETLQYLNDVLTDTDAAVDAAANALLRRLETATGEDLQKYLV